MARRHGAEAWRQLLDHVAEGVVLLDATDDHFTVLETNGRYQHLLSDPGRQLAGRPWREAFPAAEGQGILDIFRRVRDGGEPFAARDFVYRHLPPSRRALVEDGVSYWDWQCLPLRGEGGAVEQLLLIVTDVTERHRQERGRILNLQIVEQIPIGIAVLTGPRHAVTLANPRFAALLDVEPAALTDRPLVAALPEFAAADLAVVLDRVYRTGEPFAEDNFAFQSTATDEARFWNCAVIPLPGLPGGSGEVAGLMLMVADTTAHVRARRTVEELALAAQRRAGQLEAIIGSMIDGVFILDAQGLVLEANEAGMRLLGLSAAVRAERLSEYLLALHPSRGDGRPLEPGEDILAGVLAGRTLPDEQLLVGGADRPGGERVVSLSGAPVREANGRISGAVVLVRDITAQKRAEQEKDAFLSLISHEVKSPLTSIKGFSQLARRAAEQGQPGERIVRHLGVIEQQVGRIARLVSDLSDAARLQKGTLQQEPTDFDLVPLVQSAVEQQQVTTSSHTLRLELAEPSLPVHADPTRLEQVLTNLLTNAIKYSPNADQVTIRLDRQEGFAHLAVRDEGIGIPKAEQGQLFGRFYRAPNAANGGFGGLGLGLFITHELVTRNGGRIWVESEEDRGSTFHVTVPLAAGDVERGA